MAGNSSKQFAPAAGTENAKKLKKLVYGLRIGAVVYIVLAFIAAAAMEAGRIPAPNGDATARLSELIVAVFFVIFGGSILANAFRKREYISPDLQKLLDKGKITEKRARASLKTDFVFRCIFSAVIILPALCLAVVSAVRLLK